MLRKLYKKLFPQKYHWFKIERIYKNKNGNVVFSITADIGVIKKHYVLDHRYVKKQFRPIYYEDGVSKLISNGTLHAEVRCYLGKFKCLKSLKFPNI